MENFPDQNDLLRTTDKDCGACLMCAALAGVALTVIAVFLLCFRG